MKYIATRGQKERETEGERQKQNEIGSLVVCAGKETGIEKLFFFLSVIHTISFFSFVNFIFCTAMHAPHPPTTLFPHLAIGKELESLLERMSQDQLKLSSDALFFFLSFFLSFSETISQCLINNTVQQQKRLHRLDNKWVEEKSRRLAGQCPWRLFSRDIFSVAKGETPGWNGEDNRAESESPFILTSAHIVTHTQRTNLIHLIQWSVCLSLSLSLSLPYFPLLLCWRLLTRSIRRNAQSHTHSIGVFGGALLFFDIHPLLSGEMEERERERWSSKIFVSEAKSRLERIEFGRLTTCQRWTKSRRGELL